MTDKEIIKALECCIYDADCERCSLKNEFPKCGKILNTITLDLIKRQQTMIDDLAEDIEYWMQRASNDKEKAIKDFAEKLNKEITQALESNYKVRSKRREKPDYMSDPLIDVINGKIDALSGMQHCIVRVLKEMTEIRGV